MAGAEQGSGGQAATTGENKALPDTEKPVLASRMVPAGTCRNETVADEKDRMRILRPVVAGAFLSTIAGGAAGYLSPEPSGPLPTLSSWNHPLSAYQATVSAFG